MVSDVRCDISKTNAIVSAGATNTHTALANMHNVILQGVANTEVIISKLQNNVSGAPGTVSSVQGPLVENKEERDSSAQTSILGESPPPPPRACFGRDELIEKIVGFAESLTPTALIGPGGIGKTSIATTILHHERIKERFGQNRRFIRCDQFPASLTHFLRRLSEVTGADVQNPEDLASLRPHLSASGEMFVVLDNAESILDPRGADAQEIYKVAKELSCFPNISLCITSRISTIPPDCETLEIPTLSMEAARNTFYRICKYERSDLIDRILTQLDFHPLSVTLLATVALHNKWSPDRLVGEWERRRIDVLQTEHNESLAATIELSLAAPMFQDLGPDARGLLGMIAFFPQGVDEKNLDWLFPTISNRAVIFDRFCILSLTHRVNGFLTMLAPLRDYLSPRDPRASPLLCTTKQRYFTRMSVDLDNPTTPGFKEAQWITSEDVNVEHLLDVFTTVDTSSEDVWKACADFIRHIFWHKKRPIVLRPNIERLPDSHPWKPECLLELSQLFRSLGDTANNKEVLTRTLTLWRGREDGYRIAQALVFLAYTNRTLNCLKEAISQAEEALEVCERLEVVTMKPHVLRCLAWMLRDDDQLDAAEAVTQRAVDAFRDRGEQYGVCQSYRTLAGICLHKGKVEEAVDYFNSALEIASATQCNRELFWNHYCLAELFFDQERFDEAHAHAELAKSHSGDDSFTLGRGMQLQATFLHKRQRLEEADAEVSKAIEVFERIGNKTEVEKCRNLLRDIRKDLNERVDITLESGGDGRARE
ncbi:hypothetical protein BJ322DRAFT_297207 [Thelephora terrestris]|uniref:Uncharacterized protein n=1 Tax=Thelephora terrestris TaxID=56493 RepID=A0A9P6H6T5_9AGAM|nr:hypothetical protein BJ322DRAFT_297207 [Thelephora terrestris]